MSLCASCGLQLTMGELCPHHPVGFSDNWAAGNRLVCAFIHRGIIPTRLSPSELSDDYGYGSVSDVA